MSADDLLVMLFERLADVVLTARHLDVRRSVALGLPMDEPALAERVVCRHFSGVLRGSDLDVVVVEQGDDFWYWSVDDAEGDGLASFDRWLAAEGIVQADLDLRP